MNRYSETSEKRLQTAHGDLQSIFRRVLPIVDHSILCGHRGEEDQNEAYRTGKSQVKYPNSKHNALPSLAIDAGPYDPELKNIDWDSAQDLCLFAGVVLGMAAALLEEGVITHELRWGGDWDKDWDTDDERFRDMVHFELVLT